MPTKIRFHLDENVSAVIGKALRQRGFDVTLPSESGLSGATDENQLHFAASQGRVLITHDTDFLKPDQVSMPHAGIIYCNRPDRPIKTLIRRLTSVAERMSAEEMEGRIEYV